MNRMPKGVRFFSSSITPLACISSVPRTAYHQCVALYITHATHGISSRLRLASPFVPNHAFGVYIIRPSDGISSMRSIVYHPCNAWHIIKPLPCIPFVPTVRIIRKKQSP